MEFIVGQRVLYGKEFLPGIIAYIGPTSFSTHITYGLILDSAHGNSDGYLKGFRYFHCDPNHGVFCHEKKLVAAPPVISFTHRYEDSCASPYTYAGDEYFDENCSASEISVQSPSEKSSRPNTKLIDLKMLHFELEQSVMRLEGLEKVYERLQKDVEGHRDKNEELTL
ncbi:CAP-GLY domain-containing linker protein 1 [Cichlidogyrus casuarinus]|uniref:CAP-GLY domain-containing linker protein 1 n=1 Tax=Cichlidogyrus casuarinus TaxID=1844966 RepID=A0ABD2QMC4_9PLAT